MKHILKNLKFKSSNKKRLFHNLACVKMLSKAEVTTNQLYLDLMKNNQMNEQTTLTMYSKIIFNRVYLALSFSTLRGVILVLFHQMEHTA